jgi:uncharacterized membrane protein
MEKWKRYPLRTKRNRIFRYILYVSITIITISLLFKIGVWDNFKDFNELSAKNFLISVSIILLTFISGFIITTYVDKDTGVNKNRNQSMIRLYSKLENRINTLVLSKTNPDIDIQVVKDIINDILETKENTSSRSIETNWTKEDKYKIIEEQIDGFQNDINNQIKRFSKTGLVNLSIGLSLTVFAIIILTSLLLNNHVDIQKGIGLTTMEQYLLYYLPRLTLCIFIEVFSFFFLRLYKNSHNDVKYFYNEKTNIDSKSLAIKIAQLHSDTATLNKIILELSKVERNFKLKKGETTLDLEVLKVESKSNTEFMGKLSKFAEVFKNKS